MSIDCVVFHCLNCCHCRFLIPLRHSPIIIYSLAENQQRHMHHSWMSRFPFLFSFLFSRSSSFPFLVFCFFFLFFFCHSERTRFTLFNKRWINRVNFNVILLQYIRHCWCNQIKVPIFELLIFLSRMRFHWSLFILELIAWGKLAECSILNVHCRILNTKQ